MACTLSTVIINDLKFTVHNFVHHSLLLENTITQNFSSVWVIIAHIIIRHCLFIKTLTDSPNKKQNLNSLNSANYRKL
jgi:hypothetical protein